MNQYNQGFWGEDFNGTAGFDALCRHNTELKRFLKDFDEYLRNRSKLEQEYSKGLMQLNKSLKERTPMGELDRAWNYMVSEAHSSQQAHESASAALTQRAEGVKRKCRELTARRDTIEERVRQFHSLKYAQYKVVQSLLKTYQQKCRESDQATSSCQVIDRGVTSTPRDVDKAKAKMEKCQDEANKADVAYRNAVLTLDERRRDWEREMDMACMEFQDRDEEQIQLMRAEMWEAMNCLSKMAFDVDEGCERVRVVLEACDVDEEIRAFIRYNSTGSQRPAPVLYQSYYGDNSHHPATTTATTAASAAGTLLPKQLRPTGPPPPCPHPSSPTSSSSSSSSPVTPATRPERCSGGGGGGGAGGGGGEMYEDDNDPTYAVARPIL
ncbi:proline-serine-threonine phosphatase-interacting protein 2-like isoform X2 [Babylonia areolata]|uniref:proline-serine-threonine phosphatase-interacting protein 2-like isoform X2 n=1 Tax=Babylonia areolata TaxID=304850 RepID=UPI003FD64A9A